jgi:hypothetical protein
MAGVTRVDGARQAVPLILFVIDKRKGADP